MSIPDIQNCFTKSIIVAAHPDDEILWFSSILEKVDLTLLCFLKSDLFPHLKSGREISFSEYPIKNISFLNLDEATVYDDNNWIDPKIDSYGLVIPESNPGKSQYVHNYLKIKSELKKRLAGYSNVFTHNPWGEYGHEEHVQIFTAVNQLRDEMRFNLWFSTYCSNKSFPLMYEFFPFISSDCITLSTDDKLANAIKSIYQKNNCWTWYANWQWVKEETFIRYEATDEGNQNYGLTIPVNAIRIEPFISPAPQKHYWVKAANNVACRLRYIIKLVLK
jgi:LmbE family N-acetylglucosaminyl deacetylase